MSTKKIKSASTSFLNKPFTVISVIAIGLILVFSYYLYTNMVGSCEKVVESTKKMINDKNYKESYSYLKSKQSVCLDSASSKKPSLDNVQYQRYLAVSAYKTGDKKTAQKLARSAIDDAKKLSDSDIGKMGDSFAFLDSMYDIIDNTQEAQP